VELEPGPSGMATSAVDVHADLGTSHVEPTPEDVQLEDAPTSTTGVGTRIHQGRLRPKADDMPRKASGKEKPTLQSPSYTDPLGPGQ
jgi:hypothetical protein